MPACKVTKKGLKPCIALDESLQDPYGRGTRQQGIILHTMVNLNTNKFSRHLVVIKSGRHYKKGIVANNCPFCGSLIYKE